MSMRSVIRRLRTPRAPGGRSNPGLLQIGPEILRVRGELNMMAKRVAEVGAAANALPGPSPELEQALLESRAVLSLLDAEEPETRRTLQELRKLPDYELAWSEPEPLVSIVIHTADPALLAARTLPSILAQTHAELEVLVLGIGDAQEQAIADALSGVTDPRVRPDHEAAAAPRGRWIVLFDETGELRGDGLALLLEMARGTHAEAVYGSARVHLPGGAHEDVGEWPPNCARFTWAAGMYHAGLRFLDREQEGAETELRGDWWLAERMQRCGVRFARRDDLVCDIYSSPPQ